MPTKQTSFTFKYEINVSAPLIEMSRDDLARLWHRLEAKFTDAIYSTRLPTPYSLDSASADPDEAYWRQD